MWTLKETPTIEEAPSLQMKATFTFTDGTKDETASTTVSTAGEVRQAGRDLLKRLNERSEAIAASKAGTFSIEEEEQTPREPSAKEVAQREYDEALALFKDLSDKAEIDPTTFNWGRDNQRVIVQQKLQALMNAS